MSLTDHTSVICISVYILKSALFFETLQNKKPAGILIDSSLILQNNLGTIATLMIQP